MNRDNSPYGRFRDNQFKDSCEKNNVIFESYGDLLLRDAGSVLKQDDTPFLVFTPFIVKHLSLRLELRKLLLTKI